MKKKLTKRKNAKPKSMNTIVLLIGRRLIATLEREMKAIDAEINESTRL